MIRVTKNALIAILLSCPKLPLAVQNFPCPQLPDLTLYNALKRHKRILLIQTHITGDGYKLFLTTTTRYVAYFTFLNTIVYALDHDLQHRD